MLNAILSMIIVRGLTLVFPLAIIPIQLKLLGIAQYGEYNVLFAASAIGAVLVNYGFDYSASRDIARTNNDKNKISHIYSCAFFCKLINFFIVSSIMLIYFGMKNELTGFYAVIIFLFSQVLIPIYVFQGIKRMEYLIFNTAFLNISFFITMLACLFFHFKVTGQKLFLIYAILNLIAAIKMTYFINKRYNIKFIRVEFRDIRLHFRSGGWIFLSRIMSTGLSQWSIIILSSLLNPTILGIYTLADKLVRAANSFFYAIQQATYPYFCNRAGNKYFSRLMIVMIFMAISAVILLYLLQGLLLYFFPVLTGYFYSVMVIFMGLVPMSISGMIGVNFLLANDYNKEFSGILALAATFNILMLTFFVSDNSLNEASFVLLATESLVATAMIICMSVKVRRNVKNN